MKVAQNVGSARSSNFIANPQFWPRQGMIPKFARGLEAMLNLLLRLGRDEEAVSAVEYAVLLALILVAIITAIDAVGSTSSGIWASDSTKIETAIGAS
jgi:pilus assembly protein Flp/PilA